jgi:hypothetical protein
MTKLDRQAQAMRERAMAAPLTRANAPVLPDLELPGGILLALSVNK